MTKKLIGLVGFIGSGKGTVGEYLVKQHGYQTASFAGTLKDAVSSIFGWPRHLLEGDTKESRDWREQGDEYWSNKLDRLVTPRWVLQHIGTDILRNHFNSEIWIWSLEKRLGSSETPTVLTDVRFMNEVAMVNRLMGDLWWIKRDPGPIWEYTAVKNKELMPSVYPEVHSSEYAWVGIAEYKIISNDSSLDALYSKVDQCLKN